MMDASIKYLRMSFLDGYLGYKKISMKKEDKIHTTFTIERGLFYYKVMPFGLKKVGPTYQRLMNKMFIALLGKTAEIYIDDMVIKRKV